MSTEDLRYERARKAWRKPAVNECPLSPSRSVSELALQAGIYSGEFGLSWQGEDGEAIEVAHFGTWNREPGPDFCGARVVVDGREMSGDVEVDTRARDWLDHGHAANPAYNDVVLHVFFQRGAKRLFTRTSDGRAVVQVCLSGCAVGGGGRLEPAGAPLDLARAAALVAEAARFRLRRKSAALQRAIRLYGREEACFQGLAAGLGYKNNKIPFQLLAQRAGCRRAASPTGEGLLFGLAGFLKPEVFDCGDTTTREYLAALWRAWWPMRATEERLVLADDAWKFAALRPPNHPHRRLGALAVAAREFRRLLRAIDGASIEGFTETLTALEHPFWASRCRLDGSPLARTMALVGEDRATEIAVNLLLPAMRHDAAWQKWSALPLPTPSRKIRVAAEWLCGSAGAGLLQSAMHGQGLLQLHDDFYPADPASVWDRVLGAGTGRESQEFQKPGFE